MEILNEKSNLPKQVSLILGFFDGIHAGHKNVIQSNNLKNRLLITFSQAPAAYFNQPFKYIYTRNYNYKLIEQLGVEYLLEINFSNIAQLSAEEYLKYLIKTFSPTSITTGFNHTFGAKRQGTPEFLKEHQDKYNYYCIAPTKIDNEIVSSTKIKELLEQGKIEKANKFLTRNFTLKSTIIEGAKIGRTLGFPTANMKYPENIVKLPYGVYKIKTQNKIAIMNWGTKPTVNGEEILEVHIPNFNGNLYGSDLEVEILSKIRDEKKFANLEELKFQIERDVQKCLEL